MRFRLWGYAPIFLLVLGLGIFGASWSNPFILDDTAKIRDNPDVRANVFDWRTFFDAYSSTSAKNTQYRNDPSRPLTYVLYWLMWRAGDGSPRPFHILSTVLHLCTSFLLGLLVLQLFARPGPALAAAAVFLTLPINAGTVFYAFGLSDILFAFFSLAILNLALRRDGGSKLGCRILIALLFCLALAAKQTAIVIPALAIMVNRRDWRLHIQLFMVGGAYLAYRLFWFHSLGDLEAESVYASGAYFWSQGVMILKYIGLSIGPFGLCVDHAVVPGSYSDPTKILAWLLVIGVSVWSGYVWLRRSGWESAAAGWFLFIIPLLPTSSIFPTTDLFVERRAYLSSAGLTIFLMTFLIHLGSRQRLLERIWPVVAVLVIGVFSGLSYRRGNVFSTEASIYQEAISLYPGDLRSLNNLASAYVAENKLELAKHEFENVIAQDPQHQEALNNLAVLYQMSETGFTDPKKSEELYLRVLSVNPDNLKSLLNMGFLQLSAGRLAAAKDFFNRAVKLNSRTVLAHFGLGKADQLGGNPAGAIGHFQAALKVDPQNSLVLEELRKIGP